MGTLCYGLRCFSASVQGTMSEEVILNTGVPQACRLSPVLFSMYLNGMLIGESNITLLKYADDMSTICLMVRGKEDLEKAYFENIDRLVAWGKRSVT